MRTLFFANVVGVMMLSVFAGAGAVYAESFVGESVYQATWRAKVVEVLSRETGQVPGTDLIQTVHTVRVEMLDGERAGEVVVIADDHLLLEKGDRFFFNYTRYEDGTEIFATTNIDRRISLLVLALCFVGVVIFVSGAQGVRALLALAGSFFVIVYVLIPGILAGWSPIFLSVGIASLVLFCAIFFTHGFSRESLVAYLGTMGAVAFTGLLSYGAIHGAHLSGFTDEASTYLNFHTNGTLDFQGLLLGAMIVGALGALDDIAITQVAVVRELLHANATLSKKEIYWRAHRIGKDHISALINTLVLAYTGASLPLLLLFSFSPMPASIILNTEIVATEIVRMMTGSIGLVLAVPAVTLLGVLFLKRA